ncbi:hypothetical protein HJ01_02520 [Flavobacterium frigoris PS1]|uniref:Uncharacterized protein n=1 Tax=Flavobacterium frigoris (strain PS1) TaxID=1086011 RepID=H7FSF5_FLAFP|nr:hypothetical protein HJ01_02520 [Flavobacterium frigoris PS1]
MTEKTNTHASADVGFIVTADNLTRIFNLFDPILLKQYLKNIVLFFQTIKGVFKDFYRLFLLFLIESLFHKKKNIVIKIIYFYFIIYIV